MNEYQVAIAKAMDEADHLTETSGRMRPAEINTDGFGVNAMQRYLDTSDKWQVWARGHITVDGSWVVTRRGSAFMIGRNY